MASNFGFNACGGTEKRAFISYKKVDEDLVSQIALELHRLGVNLWYDEEGGEGLQLGQKWEESISENMALSSVVLAFMSRHFFTTQGYMRNEIQMALNSNPPKPLIVVYLDDVSYDDVDIADHSLWGKLNDLQCLHARGRTVQDIAAELKESIDKYMAADQRDISEVLQTIRAQRAQRSAHPVSVHAGSTGSGQTARSGGDPSGNRLPLIVTSVLAILAITVALITFISSRQPNGPGPDPGNDPTATTPTSEAAAPTSEATAPPQEQTSDFGYLRNLSVNDRFDFGTYEQDNSTGNGKEPIEWIVIKKNGDSILALSSECLDCVRYNNDFAATSWRDCSLRKWLNNDFYQTAFSSEEGSLIINTDLPNYENPSYRNGHGENTRDRVFCLSVYEAYDYFGESSKTAYPTEYAVSRGAANGSASWWMRTPGKNEYLASAAMESGTVSHGGRDVNRDGVCIRPAIWIELP